MTKTWTPLIIFVLALTVVTEITAWIGWLPSHLIPPPSVVGQSFWNERALFVGAFFETWTCVLGGLTLSVVGGFSLSLVLTLSPFLHRAIFPLAVFFQTVPIIALAPLLVIYFGFGSPTIIVSSFLVSLFPILANVLAGLNQVSPAHLELFQVYRATSWQILWKLRVPASFNSMITGLKIASGLSIIGAVAGEFVAGGGLGALIDSARTQQRVDAVFVCLILLSLMGILMLSLVQILSVLIQRIRPFGYVT
jgi:NitT/TauT family transport system permease protein